MIINLNYSNVSPNFVHTYRILLIGSMRNGLCTGKTALFSYYNFELFLFLLAHFPCCERCYVLEYYVQKPVMWEGGRAIMEVLQGRKGHEIDFKKGILQSDYVRYPDIGGS
jgi:hypothetical protein